MPVSAKARAKHNATNKERRIWLYENGFCTSCGQTYNEPGSSLCRGCTKRWEVYNKKYDPTGEKRRDGTRQRREERAAAGVCTECGNPLDSFGKYCSACRAKRRECVRVYKIKQRIKREAEKARLNNARPGENSKVL